LFWCPSLLNLPEEIAVATGEFAQAIAELSECDLGKPLSDSLSMLSEVEKKSQDTHQAQAQDDVTTFMSTGM
jgi:sorting nexin-1/2